MLLYTAYAYIIKLSIHLFLWHITNGNCSPPYSGGSGSAKPQSALRVFVRFRSTTFCGCRSLLRKALLRNHKTSVTCNVRRKAG